jgi:hypothetical protein
MARSPLGSGLEPSLSGVAWRRLQQFITLAQINSVI